MNMLHYSRTDVIVFVCELFSVVFYSCKNSFPWDTSANFIIVKFTNKLHSTYNF